MRRISEFQNTLLKFIDLKEPSPSRRRTPSQLPSLQMSRVTMNLSENEGSPYLYRAFGQRHHSVVTRTPAPFFKPFVNTDLKQKAKTKMLLRKFQLLKKIGNSSFR